MLVAGPDYGLVILVKPFPARLPCDGKRERAVFGYEHPINSVSIQKLSPTWLGADQSRVIDEQFFAITVDPRVEEDARVRIHLPYFNGAIAELVKLMTGG